MWKSNNSSNSPLKINYGIKKTGNLKLFTNDKCNVYSFTIENRLNIPLKGSITTTGVKQIILTHT